MRALLLSFFCLIHSLPSFAGNTDLYFVDRDDRTPKLVYRGALIDYTFVLERTLDGRVIAQFYFEELGIYRGGLYANYAKNLSPVLEVILSENFLEIFELEGHVFGILEDLRLVEFRMPRPQLGGGHYISHFQFHTGGAILTGVATLVCAVFDLPYAAGALATVSAFQGIKAYQAQRGCNVKLEVYQVTAPNGQPYYVKDLQTFHSRVRYPPVSEVLLQVDDKEPRKLTELIQGEDATCSTLLLSKVLKDRPGL